MSLLHRAAHRLPPSWQRRLREARNRLRGMLRPRTPAEPLPIASQGPCPRCGQAALQQPIGDFAPTHPGPFSVERFALVHCAACEVLRLEPAPTAADLDQLYLGSAQFEDPLYRDPARVARMLGYYGRCIEQLGLLPARGDPAPRLLEVGAGRAWLARAARAGHPDVVTVAQDLSGECASDCPWVDRYLVMPLERVEERDFDLIGLTHVIEHLPDPASSLAQLASRLRRGGRIFVTAPYRPAGWRLRDGAAGWRDYGYLHVPAHLSYLSRRWFEQVAPRAGLALVHFDASHDGGQAFEAVLRVAG